MNTTTPLSIRSGRSGKARFAQTLGQLVLAAAMAATALAAAQAGDATAMPPPPPPLPLHTAADGAAAGTPKVEAGKEQQHVTQEANKFAQVGIARAEAALRSGATAHGILDARDEARE